MKAGIHNDAVTNMANLDRGNSRLVTYLYAYVFTLDYKETVALALHYFNTYYYVVFTLS